MPSLLTNTEQDLGGPALPNCDSRSLRLTRYARPELKGQDAERYLRSAKPSDQRLREIEAAKPEKRSAMIAKLDARKDHLQRAADCERHDQPSASYLDWAETLPTAIRLHVRLEARLLLNMAGSVMENAGLALDRYGTVTIPGSAIKACARRAALATLRQWCETGKKPSAADNDALALAATAFNTPDDLLLAILRVFGCTDLEWGPYDPDPKSKDKNDLAWACGDDLPAERNQWPALRDRARAKLNAKTKTPDETAPTRRGAIAFLPAYPGKCPKPDLELDVLTPHHKNYYESKDPAAVALDTEDPIPVYFPAVAAKAEYTFALLPLDQPADAVLALRDHAKPWLTIGLEVFGLGAKTAAGYGWFKDISPEIEVRAAKAAAAQHEAAEKAAAKAKAEADLAARKAREAARVTMTPEQKADAELADRAADWGWMKPYLTKFERHPPDDQAALLRWFAGAGRDRWLKEIKLDASKGKKPWSQIIGAIHAAKKIHKIDLP